MQPTASAGSGASASRMVCIRCCAHAPMSRGQPRWDLGRGQQGKLTVVTTCIIPCKPVSTTSARLIRALHALMQEAGISSQVQPEQQYLYTIPCLPSCLMTQGFHGGSIPLCAQSKSQWMHARMQWLHAACWYNPAMYDLCMYT